MRKQKDLGQPDAKSAPPAYWTQYYKQWIPLELGVVVRDEDRETIIIEINGARVH